MFTFEFNYIGSTKLAEHRFRSAIRWATWKEAMGAAAHWAELCHINGADVAVAVIKLES